LEAERGAMDSEGRGVGTYNGVNPKRKEAQMGREKERKAGGRVGIA